MVENPNPPADITSELYLAWRNARRGETMAQPMHSPVWTWLIRSEFGSYAANQHFRGPSSVDAGPCWSWERFGRSSTELPDGRTLFVAGEHEDSYDPDFFIYNDVVVRHRDGRLEIFGYAKELFPPTDFHTATLVGNDLILVGSLGYAGARRPGETQVLRLDTATLAVHAERAKGEGPGWIHSHAAELVEGGRAIDVEGGMVDPGPVGDTLVENVERWRLHLQGMTWERMTHRNWPRWEIQRASREMNRLFQIRSAHWDRKMNLPDEEGGTPPFDAALLESLYVPPVPHDAVPKRENEHSVYRIRVDGVTVRYVEDLYSVGVTIEGNLPADSAAVLIEDLREKLTRLEQTPYEAVQRAP